MNKHAYLVMAHNEFCLLKVLLSLLDDERNDIFLHIDKKAKGADLTDLSSVVKKAGFFPLSDRLDVKWGGYSQIQCELLLLKEATRRGQYRYYHLLSGTDLPIKTQTQIHGFFDNCNGKEFIHFDAETIGEEYISRVDKYCLFSDTRGSFIKKELNGLFLSFQRGIHRAKGKVYQKGANWFSITDSFARYLLSREREISSEFRMTVCADEMFLQTVFIRSAFCWNLYGSMDGRYDAIRREIDWTRGNPYVWRKEDAERLQKSSNLFARKFSYSVDSDIISFVYRIAKE